MFTYDAFIQKCIDLRAEAVKLLDVPDTHNNSEFRKWRTNIQSYISMIEENGYSIKTSIRKRTFINIGRNINCYKQEMQDTINELDHLISSYKEFGEPKKYTSDIDALIAKGLKGSNEPAKTSGSTLPYPDKITFDWLRKHVPIKYWCTLGGLIVSAFLFGLEAGLSDWIKKIYEILFIS